MKIKILHWLFVAFVGSLIVSAQTNSLIVPREVENQAGDGFASALTGLDAQQVYSSGEFSDAATDIFLVTGVSFRVNDNGGNLDALLPRVTLQMATFGGSMAEASLNYRNNLQNAVTVFDHQNVHLRSASVPPGTMAPFNVNFVFDQPFAYDRTAGQLVLHIDSQSPRMQPAEVNSMDAHGSTSDRGIYFDITAQQTSVIPGFIATRFNYVAIPEPRTWMILGTALLWLVAKRRRN